MNLVEHCLALDIRLSIDNGRLVVDSPKRGCPDWVCMALKVYKEEVMVLLAVDSESANFRALPGLHS